MNDVKSQGNLGEAISARLGAAIIRGDYGVEDRLPTELQLCERLGVSRGAVREALKVLADKGLVESRRRSGTRVTDSSQWNLLDPKILQWMQTAEYSHRLLNELLEVRLAIEPEAAALVAVRRERVDFTPMAEALEILERDELSSDEKMPGDIRFHIGILSATGNRFYRQMMPLLETTLRFGHELINTFAAYGELGRIVAADHRALFEAMLDGRADEARSLSRTMVATVIDAVRLAMQAEPDTAE